MFEIPVGDVFKANICESIIDSLEQSCLKKRLNLRMHIINNRLGGFDRSLFSSKEGILHFRQA